MNVLVIGRSGQLAHELTARTWPDGVRCSALGRPEIDVTDAASVAAALAAQEPDIVVNTSAYTAVDRAESDRDAAYAVNAEGPRHLAAATRRLAIPFIHISTDYVFGGDGARPWREDDPTAPQGVYAKSKRDGECAVRDEAERHVILRTSWLFSARGSNFVRTMLRLGASAPAISVVGDQWGCPTPAADLARAVAEIALRPGPFGTYHYCGAGATTWHGFAVEIFARAGGLLEGLPQIRRISTADFGAPAPRPAYSVLDAGKLRRDYGIAQQPWVEGLDDVLRKLATRS